MYRIACIWMCVWLLGSIASVQGQEIHPWKHQISFPEDPFQSWSSPPYIKFTIITQPGYDPNLVYYQDCRQYEFHYDFALEYLDPFIGMTIDQFDDVTLHAADQEAILGAIILPPWSDPPHNEYGIQLVRLDPYTPQEIVDIFHQITSTVMAESDVTAYYFPTYEQYAVTEQNRQWLADRGVPVGSTAQWSQGNTSYSEGWALGTLKFVPGSDIDAAYTAGQLKPNDILLTDGIPAEVPSLAGILTLSPATPNSHVAILTRSQGTPFAHLALETDAMLAQSLIGHSVYLAVVKEDYELSCQIKLYDVNSLTDENISALLALKDSPPVTITPITYRGHFWADTTELLPSDIDGFGGKAANFGILRRMLPNHSPQALAFSFDLWNAFLDQPLATTTQIELAPHTHALFWADGQPKQGPYHTNFKLSTDGEEIGLFDRDGQKLIDAIVFGPQEEDISFGRSIDGGGQWQFMGNPSPGNFNAATVEANGLLINEFMADNEMTIEDPDEAGDYPDWIELYNGSDESVTLSGLFLTDDLDKPTKWQIPVAVSEPTLRDEIRQRLSKYITYPPIDMESLSTDLATIRSLFTNPQFTQFDFELQAVVLNALNDFGFDPEQKLRFRSSTNVEDSGQFTGAGLYDSFSGCPADDLDQNADGPCLCDVSQTNEQSVFDAIRKVYASFYNNNAFLERLKYAIDETQVGMAILVHSSFPDELELANGVATLERTDRGDWSATIVSQKGAVSVTNPPFDATPEEVTIEVWFDGPFVSLQRQSTLVSLREGTVLQWEDEYIELYNLLVTAGQEYCRLTEMDTPLLDFEFKKIGPDGDLIIKQIRQVPRPTENQYTTPFMLGQSRLFHTLQGRGSNVFTNHRLKSRWTLTPKNQWLNTETLGQCIYANAQIEYVCGGQIRQISSDMALLPDAEHSYEGPQWEGDQYTLADSWRFVELCNPRWYQLSTKPMYQTVVSDPMLTLDAMRLTVEVHYAEPVALNVEDVTIVEDTMLYRPWTPTENETPEICSLDDPNTGVSLQTEFYMRWSWDPSSPTGIQIKQTRIEGLTSEPIILTGYFSQSVGGGAHLCPKNFLFEPALEPGISQQILDELRTRNIRLIYFTTGARECRPTEWQDTPPEIRFYHFDEPIEGLTCLE